MYSLSLRGAVSVSILSLVTLLLACADNANGPDNNDTDDPGNPAGLRFSSITVGGHSCGVTTQGEGWCWGSSVKGELGHGQTDTTSMPVAVRGALTFQSLAAGGWHSCGITTSSAVYCWGAARQLGIGMGDTASHFDPERVSGGLTAQSITASGSHTCIVATGGAAYCWGLNFDGKLGVGVDDDSVFTTPHAVSGGLQFVMLNAASDGPTCGVTTTGAAHCWGSQNDFGQLGTGSTDFDPHPAPEAVAGGITFQSVSAGNTHACGVATGGAAYCWGLNSDGQLGATTAEMCSGPPCSSSPVAVSGGISFQSITAGTQYTCGVSTSGQAYCWGQGFMGGGSATPSAVGGSITFRSVRAGPAHACGVSTDDLAYCWGSNWDGVLGDGTFNSSSTPVLVFGQQQ